MFRLLLCLAVALSVQLLVRGEPLPAEGDDVIVQHEMFAPHPVAADTKVEAGGGKSAEDKDKPSTPCVADDKNEDTLGGKTNDKDKDKCKEKDKEKEEDNNTWWIVLVCVVCSAVLVTVVSAVVVYLKCCKAPRPPRGQSRRTPSMNSVRPADEFDNIKDEKYYARPPPGTPPPPRTPPPPHVWATSGGANPISPPPYLADAPSYTSVA
jgi:hypothetical protein